MPGPQRSLFPGKSRRAIAQSPMRYFHIPLCQISDDKVQISGRELHHLANVLRLREGDEITVLDGVGGVYEVVIVSCGSDVAIGEIRARQQVQQSQVEVTLLVGLPKADKMDMIVQKATELGVHRIAPVICQHSVPRLSSERARRRVARWQQIAVEASKQSHRPFFPSVSHFLCFDEALEECGSDLRLIFTVGARRAVSKFDDAGKMPALPDDAGKMPALPDDAGKTPAPLDNAGKMPALPDDAGKTPAPLDNAGKMPAPPDNAGKMPALPIIAPRRLKEVLEQNTRAKKVDILIGPEGGFAEDEISRALATGAEPVSLGSNILRTETAAIAALTIVIYEKDAGYNSFTNQTQKESNDV